MENRVMDIEARDQFRDAVASWVSAFLANQTPANVHEQRRQVWVQGDQPGSMTTSTKIEMFWKISADKHPCCSAEWKTVGDLSTAWEPLSRHLGLMMGSDGSGLLRCDLSTFLLPFIPLPHWHEPTDKMWLPKYISSDFEDNFRRFESFLESPNLTYQTKTVLTGLRMPESLLPLRLNDHMSIEAISVDEADFLGSLGLLKSPTGNPQGPFLWPERPVLALSWSRKLKKNLCEAADFDQDKALATRHEAERVHEALLQSLALIKYGVVALGGGYTRLASWNIGGFSLDNPRTEIPGPEHVDKFTFVIMPDDVETLQKIFAKIVVRKHHDALSVAMHRLTYAMENRRPEDRLLDGMIAAEAVCGKGSELSYRIPLRLAFTVAPADFSARRRAFKVVQDAYRARNAIVHGGKPKSALSIDGSQVSLETFVAAFEDIVRAALRVVVDGSSGPFDGDALDDAILRADVTSQMPIASRPKKATEK